MSLRLPEKEYTALCRAILERDGWRCRNCKSRSALHVHHIVFRSQGGEDSMDNLLVLCLACHEGVHRDVKDGVYGLTITVTSDGQVTMQRRPGWRPA